MFNVSALLLDDALLKCVVTEVVLFSVVEKIVSISKYLKAAVIPAGISLRDL